MEGRGKEVGGRKVGRKVGRYEGYMVWEFVYAWGKEEEAKEEGKDCKVEGRGWEE